MTSILDQFYKSVNFNPGGEDFLSVEQKVMKELYDRAKYGDDIQYHAEFLMIAYSLRLFHTYKNKLVNPCHINYLKWIVESDSKYQYLYDYHLGKYAHLPILNYNPPRLFSKIAYGEGIVDECIEETKRFFCSLKYPIIDESLLYLHTTQTLINETVFPKEFKSLNTYQLLLLSQSPYPIFPYTIFKREAGLFTIGDNICNIAAERGLPIALYIVLEILRHIDDNPFGFHVNTGKFYEYYYNKAKANGVEEA